MKLIFLFPILMSGKALSSLEPSYASWLNSDQPLSAELPQSEAIINEEDRQILKRIEGSLIGLACGDAMGAFFEFKSPTAIQKLAQKLGEKMGEMKGGSELRKSHGVEGTFRSLPRGGWTDDTSMALCLASSLLVTGKHDPYDQLSRYARWLDTGYLSSTGKAFDVGIGTQQAVNTFKRRQKILGPLEAEEDAGRSFGYGAGNGCLMRLAPVPIFFFRNLSEAVLFSGESAKTTHSKQVAIDASKYFGALIACAIRGSPKEQLLSPNFVDEHPGLKNISSEVEEIARASYEGKPAPMEWATDGNGYVLTSLAAALWTFTNDGGSFERGVMEIIQRFGYDTDTIAAIYGQLAGAVYGVDSIPVKWVKNILYEDFIKTICLHLFLAGGGRRV